MSDEGPQRSCIGCRAVREKRELLRFVLAPDRTLVPDLPGKLPGRGAYTCVSMACIKEAAAKKQFSRSFKGEVRFGSPSELVTLVQERLMERIAGYLALANKAGKVVSGTDMVLDLLRRRSPGLILIATDISRDIGEKIEGAAEKAGVAHYRALDKERLGQLLGKELRSVAAIESGGFSRSLVNELERFRNFLEGGADRP